MTPSQIKLLADLRSGAVRLVPKEATPEMRAAAYPMIEREETSRALITWEAMVKAASPDLSASLAEMIEGLVGERDRLKVERERMFKVNANLSADFMGMVNEANKLQARALAAEADLAKAVEAIELASDQLNTYRGAAVDEVVDKFDAFIASARK